METVCPATLDGEDISCEFDLHRLISSTKTNAEARLCTWTNMENIVETNDQSNHHGCSTDTNDSSIDEVRELVDVEVHYPPDCHEQFYGFGETSLVVEVANPGETTICQESGLAAPCEDKSDKCLTKSATFSSELEFSQSFMEEKESSPITISSTEDASPDQEPVKLISAIKGGRAQIGSTVKLDLRVKWASDVYDPPGSSISPPLPINDHDRPKLKKKDKHKQKHAKGKSGRGSKGEKKHANKRHGGGFS